ncbi:hypothetical protein [Roseateles sp. BYS96W]|uniref:Replication protein n=1 Tax=Pelomonas nitida TaxID=3299027 RepID=A0ABW7G8W2_9BURK
MSSSLAHSRSWAEAEPFLYHDTSKFGFVSLDSKRGKQWTEGSTSLATLADALQNLRPDADAHYISQGVFSRANRRTVNLLRMPVVFSDLDTYSKDHLKHMSPAHLCGLVIMTLEDLGLPEPSLVLSSGRGLHLKWLLSTPVPQAGLPRWQAVQRELVAQLSEFGADRNSIDASRVLRLEGTINKASGTVVHILHRASTVAGGSMRLTNGQIGWCFDDLAERVLPLSRDRIKQLSVSRDEGFQVGRIMDAANDEQPDRSLLLEAQAGTGKTSRLFGGHRLSAAHLNWNRLQDLRRLVELRGWDKQGVPDGQRDNFMFLSSCFLAHSVYVTSLESEVLSLGREFVPDWTEEKLLAKTSAALQRAAKAARGEKVHFEGKDVDPRYVFKNATLVERLQIEPAEERQMRAILSEAESRRRNAERHAEKRREAGRPTLAEVRAQRELQKMSARQLLAAGSTMRQISAELGVSINTARTYAKS